MKTIIALALLLCSIAAHAANPLISRVQLVPLSNWVLEVWVFTTNSSNYFEARQIGSLGLSNIQQAVVATLTNQSLLAKDAPIDIKSADGVVLASFDFNSYETSFPQVGDNELLYLGSGVLLPSGVATDGAGGVTAVSLTATTRALMNQAALGLTNAVLTDGSFTNGTSGQSVIYIPNGSARTNWLNSGLPTGTLQWVVDKNGTAAGTNLYVKATSGTINDVTTYVIDVDYGAACLQWDGTRWNVLATY